MCGSEISTQTFSTLGYEKKTNPYIPLGKDAFVHRALKTELLVPPYFAKMETYNQNGPPDFPCPRR